MRNYNDIPDPPWIRYADTNGIAFPEEYDEEEDYEDDEEDEEDEDDDYNDI